MTTKRQTVQGRLVTVQEQRFQMVTDAGHGLLLTLSHSAAVGARALHAFQKSNAHVVVMYEGEPNLTSGVAYFVGLIKPDRS